MPVIVGAVTVAVTYASDCGRCHGGSDGCQ